MTNDILKQLNSMNTFLETLDLIELSNVSNQINSQIEFINTISSPPAMKTISDLSRNLCEAIQVPQLEARKLVNVQKTLGLSSSSNNDLLAAIQNVRHQLVPTATIVQSLNRINEAFNSIGTISIGSSFDFSAVGRLGRGAQMLSKSFNVIDPEIQNMIASLAFKNLEYSAFKGYSDLREMQNTIVERGALSDYVEDYLDDQFGSSKVEISEDGSAIIPSDEEAVDRGFNSNLIAFPDENYVEVLLIAGFKLGEDDIPNIMYTLKAQNLITLLENSLRSLLEPILLGKFGPNWPKAVYGPERFEKMKEVVKTTQNDLPNLPVRRWIDCCEYYELFEIMFRKNIVGELKLSKREQEIIRGISRILFPYRNVSMHSVELPKSAFLEISVSIQRVYWTLMKPS